ncbi:MAG: hypothetical protein ACTHMS_10515 [Jatrophihabitans sp.]|uniref:hypothetical protein n=1 Tax=Jatrophihabitans sp. TaxID=1932789 RepID=UPI003F7E4A87
MRSLSPRTRRGKVVTIAGVAAGAMTAFFVAAAATNWTVGINSGSDGEAQSATISNLTVTATASPTAGNLLYPGGTGDVVLTISNPNIFPVEVTGFSVPNDATFADGYSDSGLSSAQAGCDHTNSAVTWAGAVNGSSANLTLGSNLVVAAAVGASPGTLHVTLTNAAAMGAGAPLACAGIYLKMPGFTNVAATGGGSITPSNDPAATTLS